MQRLVSGIRKNFHVAKLRQKDHTSRFPERVIMNQLQAMRVFLQVSESGNFGRAATQLNLSKAVVTRYVAMLETHLNTRLLNRTTRSLSLTEAGRNYLEGCRQIIEQLDDIDANAARMSRDPVGELRIVASTSFSLTGLTPFLAHYRSRYPHVKLHTTLLDRQVDLVEEGFDVGLVTSYLVHSVSLVSRPLMTVGTIVVASRDYVARHGAPESPSALDAHTLVGFPAEIRGVSVVFSRNGEKCKVSPDPVYVVNNGLMLRQAVLAGMGIGVLPASLASEYIASGELMPLLSDWRIEDRDIVLSLVYPGRRHLSAKARTFIELALEYFRDDHEKPLTAPAKPGALRAPALFQLIK